MAGSEGGEAVNTVFMVLHGDNYEGPVLPIRVFSSLEKAATHAATVLPKLFRGDFLYIEEVTLDDDVRPVEHLNVDVF
jgi:hypothetical protein